MHKSPNQMDVRKLYIQFFNTSEFAMDIFLGIQARIFSPSPTHLVCDGRYVAHALNVGRKLVHFFHQELNYFHMPLEHQRKFSSLACYCQHSSSKHKFGIS